MTIVSDAMRELIEDVRPELAHKLPPKDDQPQRPSLVRAYCPSLPPPRWRCLSIRARHSVYSRLPGR
jgi:hypothetical protein